MISDEASGYDKTLFTETSEVRFDFKGFKKPSISPYVIKVSRATTHIDEMIDFYTNVISGSLLSRDVVDGVEVARVKLTNAPAVIHFVKRSPSEKA